MKIFFDIDALDYFIEPNVNKIITLSMMTQNRTSFYAEFSNNPATKTQEYIKKKQQFIDYIPGYHIGSSEDIKNTLLNWFKSFGSDKIEMITDRGHYNMVYFNEIFGGNPFDTYNYPKNIIPIYYDINNAISEKFDISIEEAFYKSRYNILYQNHRELPEDYMKKNPLYSVWEMRELYQILKNVNFDKKG